MAVAQPVLLFGEACLLGVLLGMLYDVFRILRLAFPHGKVVVFIEDIVYFFLITLLSFSFILLWADGRLRGFFLLGEGVGAILYFVTLSLLLMKMANAIIRVVKGIVCFVFRRTVLPLWKLLVQFGQSMRRLDRLMVSRYKIIRLKRKKHLKQGEDVVYNNIN